MGYIPLVGMDNIPLVGISMCSRMNEAPCHATY